MLSCERWIKFDGTVLIDETWLNERCESLLRSVVVASKRSAWGQGSSSGLSGANRPKKCNLPGLASEWDQIHGGWQFSEDAVRLWRLTPRKLLATATAHERTRGANREGAI